MSETNHTTTAAPAEDPNNAAYEAAYGQATRSERRARTGRRAAMAGGGLLLLAAGAGLLGSGQAHGKTEVADLAGTAVAVTAAVGSRKIAERLDVREQRHGSNAAAIGHQQVRNSTRSGTEAPVWAAREVIEAVQGTGRHDMPETYAVAVGLSPVDIEGWQKTTYETPAGNVHVMHQPTTEQLPAAPDVQQAVPVVPHNPGT